MDLYKIERTFDNEAKELLLKDGSERLNRIILSENSTEIDNYVYLLPSNLHFKDLLIEFEGYTIIMGTIFSRRSSIRLKYSLVDPIRFVPILYYNIIYDQKGNYIKHSFSQKS